MATTKQAKISDLVPDDRNFNKHSEYGMSLLEKSVGKFGMGRSILLDKNNRIIAGNGITETAGQLGFEDVEIVESDGSKIIAVKRTDIDLDSPEGRELALADNATNAANLKFDKEMIAQEVGQEVAEEWGVKIAETQILSDLEYKSMYYEPKEVPEIRLEDCVDRTKFDEKMKVVDESGLPEKTKEALRWFVYRFLRIDFQAVADYYAFKASEEEKSVIERLRMVLIDGGVEGFLQDRMLRVMNNLQGLAAVAVEEGEGDE